MPTAPARPSDVVAVLVLAVAVCVTVVQPWWGRDRLAATDVAAAVAAAPEATLVQPGDLVLVHPPWRDDVTAAVAALPLPAGVRVTETFTRRHGEPWPAIVVVAEGVHPWPRALEARRAAVGADITTRGGVRFFRLPADATTDLTTDTASVHVVEADGAVVRCPFDRTAKRHVCRGLPAWMTVGEEQLSIAGRRQRCVWAHPRTGAELVVDFGVIDTSRGLRLSAALADAAADNATGAAVTYALRLPDAPKVPPATVTVHRERGFQEAVLAPRPGQTRVRLTVTTSNDGQRHTCFRLAEGA